jgi:hypothetical protein
LDVSTLVPTSVLAFRDAAGIIGLSFVGAIEMGDEIGASYNWRSETCGRGSIERSSMGVIEFEELLAMTFMDTCSIWAESTPESTNALRTKLIVETSALGQPSSTKFSN